MLPCLFPFTNRREEEEETQVDYREKGGNQKIGCFLTEVAEAEVKPGDWVCVTVGLIETQLMYECCVESTDK